MDNGVIEARNKVALLDNVWNAHGFAATNPWFSGDGPFRGDAEKDACEVELTTLSGGSKEAAQAAEQAASVRLC